jgi:N,N'-diacetylchitobiose transport system substrate-binding protein
MKARIIGVALLVAILAVAAASATGATKRSTASITVWLQVDAQSGWPNVVAAANAAFAKQHPGVDVNVQYQTWGTHLGKFDAALAGGNAPDVIEMGNTEMVKYMAAGAFQDLTSSKGTFDNSGTWLQGLAASGRYNGKTFGVPYYAGSRVVTYRTDLFRQAGIRAAPRSLAQFTSAARALEGKFGKKGFSPVFIAGTDWYFALSFVYDYGG